MNILFDGNYLAHKCFSIFSTSRLGNLPAPLNSALFASQRLSRLVTYTITYFPFLDLMISLAFCKTDSRVSMAPFRSVSFISPNPPCTMPRL